MSHFRKEEAHGYCFTGVDLQCAGLCFRRQRHTSLDELDNVEDSAIVCWVGNV